MTLADLKVNQSAVIGKVDNTDSSVRRMYDMGFATGQNVKCVNIGIFGTPAAYSLRSGKIALRKRDAKLIGVVV